MPMQLTRGFLFPWTESCLSKAFASRFIDLLLLLKKIVKELERAWRKTNEYEAKSKLRYAGKEYFGACHAARAAFYADKIVDVRNSSKELFEIVKSLFDHVQVSLTTSLTAKLQGFG
ncbi:hypothetical protein NDU88_007382 [Pleurodeles waltl]|uniref:Uncharacterized protein n=1 Tax=Pleurodeles waltl TaxID=8319 RepID=A0AAV7NSX6_PLEWA|nr:hypothetical protein NDU88_007382 [Pleurodeles waltl]